jgi:hypothetical protein
MLQCAYGVKNRTRTFKPLHVVEIEHTAKVFSALDWITKGTYCVSRIKQLTPKAIPALLGEFLTIDFLHQTLCFSSFQISLYTLVLIMAQNDIYPIDFIGNKGFFNIAEGNIDGYFKQVTALSEAT